MATKKKELVYPVATVANLKRYYPEHTNLVVFSIMQDEEYSANPGDYWNCADNHKFMDVDGNIMYLGLKVIEIKPFKEHK